MIKKRNGKSVSGEKGKTVETNRTRRELKDKSVYTHKRTLVMHAKKRAQRVGRKVDGGDASRLADTGRQHYILSSR